MEKAPSETQNTELRQHSPVQLSASNTELKNSEAYKYYNRENKFIASK
jgi:hypothetical protein